MAESDFSGKFLFWVFGALDFSDFGPELLKFKGPIKLLLSVCQSVSLSVSDALFSEYLGKFEFGQKWPKTAKNSPKMRFLVFFSKLLHLLDAGEAGTSYGFVPVSQSVSLSVSLSVCLSVRNHSISRLLHYFFLIFCMKLEGYKG